MLRLGDACTAEPLKEATQASDSCVPSVVTNCCLALDRSGHYSQPPFHSIQGQQRKGDGILLKGCQQVTWDHLQESQGKRSWVYQGRKQQGSLITEGLRLAGNFGLLRLYALMSCLKGSVWYCLGMIYWKLYSSLIKNERLITECRVSNMYNWLSRSQWVPPGLLRLSIRKCKCLINNFVNYALKC